MSFQIVKPGALVAATGIGPGEASITKAGDLTLRVEDLKQVGIEHFAIVLADAETMRIALRAVDDGEGDAAVVVSNRVGSGRKDSGRRKVGIRRAIAQVYLTPEAVRGRYSVSQHDGLLVICLQGAKEIPKSPVEPGHATKGNKRPT